MYRRKFGYGKKLEVAKKMCEHVRNVRTCAKMCESRLYSARIKSKRIFDVELTMDLCKSGFRTFSHF